MKILTKKRFVLFFLVVALTVLVAMVIAKISSPTRMVKEGKITCIHYYAWDYSNTEYPDIAQADYRVPDQSHSSRMSEPSNTVLHFEDGERIVFVGTLPDLKVGMKHRIVYHEEYVYAPGNPHWSGYFYVIDSIEMIE